MKNLKFYKVKELNNNELNTSSGGAFIGVWLAKGLDAIEGAIYDLFAGQANHVQRSMQRAREAR